MTRTSKRRLLFALVVTLFTIPAGVVCGFLLGGVLALHQSYHDLDDYARAVQVRATTFLNEGSDLLHQLNAVSVRGCSDEALASMRGLLFRAEYVHDLGLAQAGKVLCSAEMGRLETPIAMPVPDYVENFGGAEYRHYRGLPPRTGDPDENVGLDLGPYYAVYSQYRFAHLGPKEIGFFRLLGEQNRPFIQKKMQGVLDTSQYVLNRNGVLWKNGYLFVTRCSTPLERISCSTAYLPVRSVFSVDQTQTAICMVAGGLAGLLMGLFFALLYQRSQSVERQLQRAIRRGEIQLVYQPIVELSTGRVVAAEALARWTDQDGYAVSPLTFVRVAEERGYVGELTEAVIRRALSDLGPMLRLDPEFCVHVNVTATDLAGQSFLPMLERLMMEAGVAARHLCLEVTESTTARLPELRETIQQLRQRGHRVEIDDFGTGYSSLSYLHGLSVDAIKIDRCFTQSIGTGAVTAGILPLILSMAQALDLQVVAEGIETAEQAAYFAGSELEILGQGWLFGRPRPAALFFELLLAERPALAVQESL